MTIQNLIEDGLNLTASYSTSINPKLHRSAQDFRCRAVMSALCCLLTWVFVSATMAASGDEAAYQSGLRAVKMGDHSKAVGFFSRAIELNPKDHRYYNDRGIAYRASGAPEKALADYTKALEIKPDYPNALNNRGLVYVQQGLFDKAIADFNEALKQGGFQAKIHTNLGLAYAGKGDHREAIRHYEKATVFRPADSRAFFFMAQSFEELGEKDKALKMYQVALGVIKDPGTEAVIEKKIAQLEKKPPQGEAALRKPTIAGGIAARMSEMIEKSSTNTPPAPKTTPEKRAVSRRNIAKAQQIPHAVSNVEKKTETVDLPKPATLEELNRVERSRALVKFSPNAAEIFRQGLQFMDQSDTRKALIRFEDTLQLERRNRNVQAVAWSLLEIGRVYLKIGDHTKALPNLEGALKAFRSLKSSGGAVVTLVETATAKKAAGQTDQANKLLSEAARDAASSGLRQVASVLEDMAAGRPVKESARKGSPTQAAESSKPNLSTAVAQNSESLTAHPKQPPTRPAVSALGAKLSTQLSPQASPKPHSDAMSTAGAANPTPPDRTDRKPPIWGRHDKIQAAVDSTPIPTERTKAVETTPAPIAKPIKETERQSERDRAIRLEMGKEKPVRLETRVGGEPAQPPMVRQSAAPVAPTVTNGRQPAPVQPVPSQKLEPRLAAVQEKSAINEKRVIQRANVLEEPATRLSKEETSSKRIHEDLAELKKFKKSRDEMNMVVVLERLAKRYTARKEYENALHSLIAALSLREKLGAIGAAGDLYVERGKLKEKMKDSPGALEDMTRALALSSQEKNAAAKIAALRDACKALAEQLGLEPSITLEAFQTLWNARAAEDNQSETDALYVLGRLYDRAHKPLEALNYYERSSASVLTDKARMYGQTGRHKLAEESYNEALETFKKLDYSRYLSMIKQFGNEPYFPKQHHR